MSWETYRLKTKEQILSENDCELSDTTIRFKSGRMMNGTMVKSLGKDIKLKRIYNNRYDYVGENGWSWLESWIDHDEYNISEVMDLFDEILEEL